MSNSLFFFITAVYILWVAISGAKAKQKRKDAHMKTQDVSAPADNIMLTDAAYALHDETRLQQASRHAGMTYPGEHSSHDYQEQFDADTTYTTHSH